MPKVRDAKHGDARALATVHVESWRVGYRGCLPDGYLDSLVVDDRLAWWSERLGGPDEPAADPHGAVPSSPLLVLEDDDGVVVGFASGEVVEPGTGEVHTLYLLPGTWGRGWGRLLFDELVDRLRAQGCTQLGLTVLVGNERARRFYEHAGWSATGTEEVEVVWGVEVVSTRYELLR